MIVILKNYQKKERPTTWDLLYKVHLKWNKIIASSPDSSNKRHLTN